MFLIKLKTQQGEEEVLTTNYYYSIPKASFRKLTVNSNLTSRLEAVPATKTLFSYGNTLVKLCQLHQDLAYAVQSV